METRVLFLGTRTDAVEALMSETAGEGVDGDLAGEGVTVSVVTRPDVAAVRLREAPFDCVVCEVSAVPTGLDGFLRGAREAAPDLPVVLWTPDGESPAVSDDLYDSIHGGGAGGLREAVAEQLPDERTAITVDTGGRDTDPAGRGRVLDIWDQEEFFDMVLDNLVDVFFVFTIDRELIAWNARLEEVTGHDADHLAGYDPIGLIVEEEREEAYATFLEVVTSGEATMEIHVPTPDGKHPFEVTASLITDDSGEPRYISGIGRDVSELRRKEAELERKRAELNEAVEELEQSNAELEHFAYVASHDMKEPLRMISNYLQLLQRRHGDQLDDDAQEFVQFAVEGAERMSRIIDQLLTFSRIDRQGGTLQPVDCEAVFDTVCRNLEVAIEESDADITVGDLPTVTGDRDQLVQLLQNLVGNAITYAGEDPPEIEVTATRRGEMCEFAVSDEGVGIPEDRIDRVFDIFYTDSDDDSTGIGLAIAKKIVERHGGEIDVESTVGEGTTFRFTVPHVSVSPEDSLTARPH